MPGVALKANWAKNGHTGVYLLGMQSWNFPGKSWATLSSKTLSGLLTKKLSPKSKTLNF
jgi:hypothetical protein